MVLISKMIKPGFALVAFGSAGLSVNDHTGILPDAIYNWIFIGLLGFGFFYLLLEFVRANHPELIRVILEAFIRRMNFSIHGIYQ